MQLFDLFGTVSGVVSNPAVLADAMFAQVPEPQSILLLMAALLALAFIAKRR